LNDLSKTAQVAVWKRAEERLIISERKGGSHVKSWNHNYRLSLLRAGISTDAGPGSGQKQSL